MFALFFVAISLLHLLFYVFHQTKYIHADLNSLTLSLLFSTVQNKAS